MNIVAKRIQKEIKGIQEDASLWDQITIEADDTLMELKGTISGPPDTPYSGGKFAVLISLPEAYPFEAPSVRFETKIWHPNVSSASGYICLDILTSNWSASQTILTILLSIQSLMQDPVPDDPQDAVVAKQMKRTKKKFRDTARYWTHVYATPEGTVLPDDLEDYDQKVKSVMASQKIGQDQAVIYCSNRNWIVKQVPVRASKRVAAASAARSLAEDGVVVTPSRPGVNVHADGKVTNSIQPEERGQDGMTEGSDSE